MSKRLGESWKASGNDKGGRRGLRRRDVKRTRQISREDEWMKKGKVGEKFTCASHWSEKKKDSAAFLFAVHNTFAVLSLGGLSPVAGP